MGGDESRIGLALSGGGFRAAFFHVGVLARLAELGVLPRVEVISTVSGGSIVGALYYLRLKDLLEEHPDEEIDSGRYVELVADVERRLRDGVGKNIRTRIFTNAVKNFAMLSPRYSRSDRIGDLYDRHFYKDAWGGDPGSRSLRRDRQIEIRNLKVQPPGTDDFDPGTGNAARRNKVPILLLNATSLNSGRNWRFEAIRMGEPLPEDPAHAAIANEIDKSMRLDQGYFEPGPDQPGVGAQGDFPLGLAVAASAAVPGVFQPLAISDMYTGIRVQLVDGGVQDNQGLQGLLDRECTHLIVSDASGQLDDKEKPAPQLPQVLKRSASIGQSRVRSEQLTAAAEGHAYALVHLRKGLPEKVIQPGQSLADAVRQGADTAATDAFGVAARVQAALSNIRTDLDFFSETEARSLELDGYLMSTHELREEGFERLGGGEPPPPDPSRWGFGDLRERIAADESGYVSQLDAGSKSFFRLLALRRLVGLGWGAGMAVLLAAIAYAILRPATCLLDGRAWWLAVPGWALTATLLASVLLFVFANLSLVKTRLYPR